MTYIITAHPLPHVDHAIALATVTAAVRCYICGYWYSLRPNPIALAFDGDKAIVQPGFVEVCPWCFCEHQAGTRLQLSEEVAMDAPITIRKQ